MGMEIMTVLHFFILLPVLMAVVCALPVASHATDESRCLVNSTSICFKFYDGRTDLHGSKDKCKKENNSILLSEQTYNGNTSCFEKYLQDLKLSTVSVWLGDSNLGPNMFVILNISGKCNSSGEYSSHSRICIKKNCPPQGSDSTTLSTSQSDVTAKDNSANNEGTPETLASGGGRKTAPDKDRSEPTKTDGSSVINKNSPTATDNSNAREDNHLSVAIPVALATAAIVLTICCCTCVVCGVILYRKRNMIIRSIRKINTPDGVGTSALDSVELRSQINVSARIKPSRPDSGKFVRESSFLHNMVPADSDNEVYSTVNTDNLYSNVDYLLRSEHLDQPGRLYYESSLAQEPYRDSRALSLRPPAYVQCVASHENQSQKDSGRYLSDGLLYVTVDHTAHGRKTRPVKAKSEEHVEYLKLDFDKIDKMRKKKSKTLDRVDPRKKKYRYKFKV